MIDFSMEDLLALARAAEMQKRFEADGVKAPEPEPVALPEDLRGKIGEAEAERNGAPADPSKQRD